MGQLMNIVGPLLLLGGAVFVVAKRCELLGLCGETAPDSGTIATAAAEPVTNPVQTPTDVAAGEASSGCCHCKMVNGRAKCEKNGDGAWWNPPPGSDGTSNDQDLQASAKACAQTQCGGNTTGLKDPSKPATKQNTGVAATGSQGNPGSTTKGVQNKNNSVTGSGQKITPKPGTSTATYFNANPKGYKPGGGTYYTYYPQPPQPQYMMRRPVYRSYFVDPSYIRPFRLYHRIAN